MGPVSAPHAVRMVNPGLLPSIEQLVNKSVDEQRGQECLQLRQLPAVLSDTVYLVGQHEIDFSPSLASYVRPALEAALATGRADGIFRDERVKAAVPDLVSLVSDAWDGALRLKPVDSRLSSEERIDRVYTTLANPLRWENLGQTLLMAIRCVRGTVEMPHQERRLLGELLEAVEQRMQHSEFNEDVELFRRLREDVLLDLYQILIDYIARSQPVDRPEETTECVNWLSVLFSGDVLV